MATAANEFAASSSAAGETKRTLTQFMDRWIYVFMAALFIVTALVGFVPDSLAKVGAVQAGFRPPFPLVLHVHAVLMGSWLLLLLTQTTLMATGRRAGHMQLGVTGMVLAPAMVLTGFWLVPTMVQQAWPMIAAAPPEALPLGAENTYKFLSSLVAVQISGGVLFSIFVGWALLVRKRDSELHKRLMILATVVPLPAAIDRIVWLPQSYPESPLSPLLWPLLWIMPMFLWDLYRRRRVHKAYLIWGAIYLPAAVLIYNLWWSPWWMATAQRLVGVA